MTGKELSENKPIDDTISGNELLERIQTLTARETEVLDMILKGLSNDQIALALFRSPKTVDKHCQRIYRKLDVHRRVNLVRLCLESGYCNAKSALRNEACNSTPETSKDDDDSYAIIQRLVRKGRAWDRLRELEQHLSSISSPQCFGEFVCALTRVFGVKYATITEYRPGDTCGVMIAYSVDGELVSQMGEYQIEGTPCQNTLRDGRYFLPEGACGVFPADTYLVESSIESYAGVRLDDRFLGVLGVIWICDTKPMPDDEMILETLNLMAPPVAADLAVQIALDQVGDT